MFRRVRPAYDYRPLWHPHADYRRLPSPYSPVRSSQMAAETRL
jgi:hypothetical protein